MEKSIIFFDVDGTLVVGGPREYIPDSAVRAIRSAREKGHLCYLCTGRSAAELYPGLIAHIESLYEVERVSVASVF